MYKLISCARDTHDLSIGFDRDRSRTQRELTSNKKIMTKHHVRLMLRDVYGFAQHQQKTTYGLGYEITLTINVDNAVFNKANATNIC